MPWAAPGAPHHVGMPRCAEFVAWFHPVESPHLYNNACKWSAKQCRTITPCLHILQVLMTLPIRTSCRHQRL
jgi:hypothetical protein